MEILLILMIIKMVIEQIVPEKAKTVVDV